MKAEYINPFIESVQNLFATKLRCHVDRGTVSLGTRSAVGGDITGLVDLDGRARGLVALTFPMTTAQRVVGRLSEVAGNESNRAVSNGVAELVGIVAHGAQSNLRLRLGRVDLGPPIVFQGPERLSPEFQDATWLDVPFLSELGAFNLRFTLLIDD